MRALVPSFFERDALEVAHDLVGAELVRGPVRVRLTELEAYRYPGDTANHARVGRTARNAPMWGPPGHLYVYLCYGMHAMLNFVCGPEGHPSAVLVRGVEPREGLALLRERRARRLGDGTIKAAPQGPALLDGPGKVAAALGLSVAHSGLPLGHPDALQVLAREAPVPLAVGPRVGIDYALPEHVAALWRVAEAGSPWVGHRSSLVLLAGGDAP